MALRISRRILAFILIIFSIFSLTACYFNPLDGVYQTNVSRDPQINELYTILNKYYYKDLPLNIKKIESVENLLEFTDAYTYIFEYNSRSIDAGNEYEGLGITIQDHELGLLVVDININVTIDDRLYPGDIITHVNEAKLEGLSLDDKREKLQGELGKTHTLTLNRLDQSVDIEVEIVKIQNPSVSFSYDEQWKIGYIKIHRFEKNTHLDFNNALNDFEQAGLDFLIIDVRDNGGGYVNSTVEILNNFVYGDEPFIYMDIIKEGKVETYKPIKEEGKPYEILTLINRNSASASEMLAGTLKQFGYNTFGEKSYGKDVFQGSLELINFGDDMYFSFTMGYWLLKDKTTVRGGIEPDIFHIETGLRMYSSPRLTKEYKLGDATSSLLIYQYLISLEVNENYEPGLFNLEFENMVRNYQINNDLEETGILDINTQINLITLYRQLIKEGNNDNLLNEAINYAKQQFTN